MIIINIIVATVSHYHIYTGDIVKTISVRERVKAYTATSN